MPSTRKFIEPSLCDFYILAICLASMDCAAFFQDRAIDGCALLVFDRGWRSW